MAALAVLETLLILAAASFAVRAARAARDSIARPIAAIVLLLLVQIAIRFGFLELAIGTGRGAAYALPPGSAALVQIARLALLLIALRLWVGLVRLDLPRLEWLALIAAGGLAMAWGPTPFPLMGAIAVWIALARTRAVQSLTGWRRGAGLIGSLALLAALSLIPVIQVTARGAGITLSLNPSPWPPALLPNAWTTHAAAELAAIRPLDHAIQGLTDLFRVQVAFVAFKLLFLPIKLSGMSLERRFTINHILTRTIPQFLSLVLLSVALYLLAGHFELREVRAAFDRTLARAAGAGAALAARPDVEAGTPDPATLDAARSWLGADSAGAAILVRDAMDDSTRAAWRRSGARGDLASGGDSIPARPQAPHALAATGALPPALRTATMTGADSGAARGIVVAGDTLYLATFTPLEGGRSLEIYVPIDSVYLRSTVRPMGADLQVSAEPLVALGGDGIDIGPLHRWRKNRVETHWRQPDPAGHPRARYFLGRNYLPNGEWDHVPDENIRGGIELLMRTSVPGLISGGARMFRSVYADVFTGLLLLLGMMLFSMLEGFAVRSGRGITRAVLDETKALATAAERFGAGDLAYRLPVRGKTEFGVVAASLNDMAASLERQRGELIAKERIERDLAVARGIQQRFLPQQPPVVPGLDLAGVSVPSREVGGDLFYWFPHPDGRLGLALGDVSGKSVPAALLMSNVLAVLRAQALEGTAPGRSLSRANQLIVDQIEPGRFVTLFQAEIDLSAGTLCYASAGHNPPLLLDAAGDLEWLVGGGVPLGVVASARYEDLTHRFEPGDTLVVYSDGVTEAEGRDPASAANTAPGSERPMFGEERLAAVVRAHRGGSARELLDAILEALRAFGGGAPPSDDITLIVARRSS